jgi:hypothetical protein
MSKLFHTTVYVDERCLDLLLTENEIAQAFERSLVSENKSHIDFNKCCDCWSTTKPPQCSFWNKILGLCKNCG